MSNDLTVLDPEIERLPAPIPEKKKEIQPLNFQDEITKLIPTAGTIQLTETQRTILYKDVDPETVEIRPDGLIYLPWMEYVSRLKDAFGMGWAIIPQGMPALEGDLILWGFYLVVNGVIAGFAMGEQLYQPTNQTMTHGDAIEGAKSNALMRLCKGIGISLELWRPSFIRSWKEKYAESYPATWPDGKPKLKDGKQKTEWRKKKNAVPENSIDVPKKFAPQKSLQKKTSAPTVKDGNSVSSSPGIPPVPEDSPIDVSPDVVAEENNIAPSPEILPETVDPKQVLGDAVSPAQSAYEKLHAEMVQIEKTGNKFHWRNWIKKHQDEINQVKALDGALWGELVKYVTFLNNKKFK